MKRRISALTEGQEQELKEVLESKQQGHLYDDYVNKIVCVIPNCSTFRGLGIAWLEKYVKRVKLVKDFEYLLWDTMDFEDLGRRLVAGEYVMWDSKYIILEKSKVALELFTW